MLETNLTNVALARIGNFLKQQITPALNPESELGAPIRTATEKIASVLGDPQKTTDLLDQLAKNSNRDDLVNVLSKAHDEVLDAGQPILDASKGNIMNPDENFVKAYGFSAVARALKTLEIIIANPKNALTKLGEDWLRNFSSINIHPAPGSDG